MIRRRTGTLRFARVVSHLEPDEAHQLDGVALGDDTVAQRVIETHFAALNVILKMHVAQALAQGLADLRQSQVVRGDNAERSTPAQRLKQTLCANPAIFGGGALKQVVKQEQQRQLRALGQIKHGADVQNLRVKAGAAFL